jgi:hypothetical protein
MRGLETRSSRPDDVARLLAQLRVPDVRATIIDEMEQGKVQILSHDLVCSAGWEVCSAGWDMSGGVLCRLGYVGRCAATAPCRACV